MKIVLCHGTYDLLHPGHVKHFQDARALGDYLVVTLTADAFINKGPGRPIFNENERLAMILSLACVNYAEICHEKTGLSMIDKYQPHIYAKGSDYLTVDKHGSLEIERQRVESYGGKLMLTPHSGYSSSAIIERIRGMK